MDKIKDLLSDLEKKVESNLNELLSLREPVSYTHLTLPTNREV